MSLTHTVFHVQNPIKDFKDISTDEIIFHHIHQVVCVSNVVQETLSRGPGFVQVLPFLPNLVCLILNDMSNQIIRNGENEYLNKKIGKQVQQELRISHT
jgi:hypothetical protein